TREASAEATGRPLVLSTVLLRNIRAKFRRARYRSPPTNVRQAYLLEGATALPNQIGAAPGQWLPLGFNAELGVRSSEEGTSKKKNLLPRSAFPAPRLSSALAQVLILLPGPPRELYPMLENAVLPRLRKIYPQPP